MGITKLLKLFGPAYVNLSDEELMELIVQNNSQAFETLYFRYKDKVYSYLYLKLGKNFAEDELQEIFYKLYKHKSSFKRQSKFKTWFWKIINNSIIDKYRSLEFNQHKLNDELQETDDVDNRELDEDLILKASTDSIMKIVSEQSEINKEIFFLYIFAEMTFQEIAINLEMNENSVKTKYFRVKKIIIESFLKDSK